MSTNITMVDYAIDTLIHAIDKDTIVLGENGVPMEDQVEYKKDLLRELFELVGREL